MNIEAIQGLGVHDEVAPLASALPGAGAAQGVQAPFGQLVTLSLIHI